MNNEYLDLQEKLIKAITYYFNNDATTPGIVVSHLKSGMFYVSIVRYGSSFSRGKKVVCKVENTNLVNALTELSEKFLKIAQPKTDPVSELKSLIKPSKPTKIIQANEYKEDEEDPFPPYDDYEMRHKHDLGEY